MKTLLAVDGNSLLNRAFYGVKPLTTRDGRNTNAIYGFMQMLYKQLTELSPDYAAVAFDLRAPTFRHLKCDYYKATRHGMPSELAEQLPYAKTVAGLMGFHVLTKEGYEADDILGTLSMFSGADVHAYIMTGDRDSYQLITKTASVLYVSTKDTSVYDEACVAANYGGATPAQLIDIKSLMGDTSDNIPGVAGVGEKTAVGLIAAYKTLDGVYAALDAGDAGIKGALVGKLTAGRDKAYESRFLAEICKTVPLEVTLDELRYGGLRKKELLALCTELELHSLIKRMELDVPEKAESGTLSLFDTGVEEKETAKASRMLAELPKEGLVFADVDTASDTIYFLGEDGDVYKAAADETTLETLFVTRAGDAVVHDFKALCLYALTKGIRLTVPAFDVLLASYVLDPSKVLSNEILHPDGDTETVFVRAVRGIKAAYEEQHGKIAENGMEKLLYEIEIPTSAVLAEMEYVGFKLNTERLKAFSAVLDERLQKRRESIYAYADGEFNINSTKQLAEVLFEKLGLPAQKKTKSGYSTDAETLEHLRPYHPIIDEILEYRAVSKLRSTYTDPLIEAADEDGRIHTNFKQAFTLTGRLSSAEPNLQNIPVRTEEGAELRKFFEAGSEEQVLIDADYSQIELRLLAAMSGDENMIEAYRSGKDIHTSTAASVFGVPAEEVTPELRKKAKAVNFGIIYGISDFSLAGDMHVSRKEAADYIAAYFAGFPRIKAFLEGTKASAREKGYSETLFGRRRYIPELAVKNKNVQSFGERVAMNAPIQGTAADIIKIAMIAAAKRLREEGLDARLVLQVHDELIVESSKHDAARACEVLREAMESAVSLPVRLTAEVHMGRTWFEAKD